MTREEIIRNLKYTMEKHKNDTVNTFGTNISVMCKDILDYLEQEQKTGHWEWLTEDKYRCSNCNSETRVDECLNEPMYEFCPFCRAIMKSEVSE